MKGKTAKHYSKNKSSYAKKLAYDKKYNAKPEQRKKRAKLVKINRDKGTYGNGDNKDYDHAKGKMVDASVNRGRTSGTKGDKKARGKKRYAKKRKSGSKKD